MYKVEVIQGYSDNALQEILTVCRESLPKDWEYPDSESYYSDQLLNENAIHLLLRRNAEPIGYLHAIPHNEAIQDDELRRADPYLVEEEERFYIETMTFLPQFAKALIGGKLCLLVLRTLTDIEARKREICKFSMHLRISTGLNQVIRKLYKEMVTKSRTIESWPFYNSLEPTEYLEITYSGRTTVPARKRASNENEILGSTI